MTISGFFYRLYLAKQALFSKTLPIPQAEDKMSDGLFNRLPTWALNSANANVFELMKQLGLDLGSIPKDLQSRILKHCRSNNSSDLNPCESDVAMLLYNLVCYKEPKVVAEIGIYNGAGSIAMISALESLKAEYSFHAVEMSQTNIEVTKANIMASSLPLERVSFHRGTSSEMLSQLNQKEVKFDFCFLDADHTLKGVELDWSYLSELMAPSGILVMHDSQCWNGVRQLSNKLYKREGKSVFCLSTSHGSGVSIIFGF